MHPNAEIGYLTINCNNLFNYLLDIQGGGSGGGGGSKDDGVMKTLDDFKARCPVQFNMLNILEKAKDRTPYVVVVLQECERMNTLL